jgi:hypothetical protein
MQSAVIQAIMQHVKAIKMKLLLMIIILFIALGDIVRAAEEDSSSSNPETSPISWSDDMLDRLLSDLGDELDNQGERISSSIFDALTDIELYEFGSDNLSLGFEVQRKVFNNRDITNTFTVVDFFRVPVSLPIPLLSQGVSASNGTIGFHLGANLSISSMNIRQVLPKDLESIADLNGIRKKKKYIETLDDEETFSETTPDPFLADQQNTTEEDRDVLENISQFLKWKSENTLTRARYSSILNLFTQPFKLPLTNRALRKMDVGEISSYKIDGAIQLGGTVGFSGLEILNIPDLTAGISVSTYLHGKYTISILKESETQVQLKVTKGKTTGYAASLGIGSPNHEIFGGVVVLGSRMARITESVIPFNLSINKSLAKTFDVGYRFDLTNPEAKKAYFKAVYGMFKDSEDLANIKNGVSKIYTREQKTRTSSRNYSMKLSLIYHRGHVTSSSQSSALITLNGEEHHLFKSINIDSRGYGTAWGDGESKRYKFTTTIDGEVFSSDQEKGIALQVEASTSDLFTNSDELRGYISEVVTMTGIKELLKEFPEFDPQISCADYRLVNWSRRPGRRGARGRVNNTCFKKRDKAFFGKTSFFYKLNFTRSQLMKFANFDESQMWSLLETAYGVKKGMWQSSLARTGETLLNSYEYLFNIPLALFDIRLKPSLRLKSAKIFLKHWKSLKNITDIELLSKTVTKLFNTNSFSYEFLKVIKLTLGNEEVSYYVSAQAKKLFGTITRTGKVIGNVDTITARAANLIEFDRVSSRVNINPNAYVKGLKLKRIAPDQLEVEFILPKRPKYVFFRVDRTASWKFFKNLGKFILLNENEHFVKGKNKIIIKLNGDSRLSKELAEKIFNSSYVTFMLAISFGEDGWGNVSSERIKVKKNNR